MVCVFVSTVVTLVLFTLPRLEPVEDIMERVRIASVYFDIVFILFVAYFVVFFNRKFKLGVPAFLVWVVCVHLVLSVDFGTSLGWYDKFPWWDDFLHTTFGFIGAAAIYYLFLRWRKNKLDVFDHIVIVLLVVAFAALWEIFEYVAGKILYADTQDVGALVAAGRDANYDTMMDLIDAIVGAVCFELYLLACWGTRVLLQKKAARSLPEGPPEEGEAPLQSAEISSATGKRRCASRSRSGPWQWISGRASTIR